METWLMILISISITILLKLLPKFVSPTSRSKKLPPGPLAIPVLGNLRWLRESFSKVEHVLRHELRPVHGPIISLHVGSSPHIFIASHSTAHRALIQNGAVFSDRPTGLPTTKITTSNQHNINSARYGAMWRHLRRNLTSEILHPSRVNSYSHARTWVFQILLDRLSLAASSATADGVRVKDHFQYAMFCLLVLMCFGDKRDEDQIRQIETVERDILLSFGNLNKLDIFPQLGKIIFRSRWNHLRRLRKNQEDVLIPIIRSRQEFVKKQRELQQQRQEERVVAYVDSLVDLELPDEKRKLTEEEIVSICAEFLDAGTDTTSTALQWIMANLVKYPEVQAKLYKEIAGIVGQKPKQDDKEGSFIIKEKDLAKLPYLKAVVLEGLRRHPPSHFLLPHSVTEDVELDGYVIPKGANVNVMVADMGWDPEVWDQPMKFKPERFLSNNGSTGNCYNGYESSDAGLRGEKEEVSLFDITGSREIKMMPFGVGRRICPGANLSLLHLEFFVANLVWYFEWKAVDGDEVNLSEKSEFTVVMKNPLRVNLCPRG